MSGLTLEKLDPQFEAEPTGLTLEKLGVSFAEPESFIPEMEERQTEEEIGSFGAAGRGLAHGVIGVGESLATGMEYLGGKVGSERLIAGGEVVGDYLREKAKPFEAPTEIQGNILGNKGLMAKGSWWTYHLADMAPSFGAMMVPSLAVGKAISAIGKGGKVIQLAGKTIELTPKVIERLAKIGSMTVAGVTGGGMEGSSTYQEILKRGGSREDAEAGLEAMTLAAGALNSIGFGKITGKLGAKKSGALVRFLKGGSWEGLTEYLEEPAEVLIKRGILPDVAFSKDEAIEQLKAGVNVIPIAGVMGGGASVAFNIKEAAEGSLTDDQTYSRNRDQFVEQLSKGFADGTVSIEDVMEAKTQHEEGESPDPKVISAFNSIISKYEETTGPVEEAEAQEALVALESFKEAIDSLDARVALKRKDEFVNQYPWLEDQANEAIIDAQVYVGARKRVGILTPEEQAEREYGAYEPEMPGEAGLVPAKPKTEFGPTSIFELQEGVKRRQAEAAAKEKELALQRAALPPGQGFEVTEPKPETRLRPSPEKIEGPTYPEGAEYVAGKEAPEGLGVEHKPILTAKGVPYKNEKQAKNALKYQKRFKKMGVAPETHEVIPVEDGFGITKKAEPKETKLKEISKKVKAETPTMLKESDKVNDVTLGTLVDIAAEDPAKALEHAAEATVSKAKLIEGIKNKGLKAMGEAKTKEERAEIAKNLEKTLRGIEEGEPVPEIKLEKVSITDKSVQDHPQQAIILGDTITIISKVGRRQTGKYSIQKSEWKATKLRPTANPDYNKTKLIEKYTKDLDAQPGGSEQAVRIRDSQISAINKAFERGIEEVKKPKELVAETPAKEPWEMGKAEFLRPVKAAAYLDKETGKIIEGTPEEVHFQIAERVNLPFKDIEIRYEPGFINYKGEFLTREEANKLIRRPDRKTQLIVHKEFVQEALKSGKLTPKKYAEFHEKDYGPPEKFIPEVTEIVKRALKDNVVDIDQLSLSETKALNYAVEKGILEKARGGSYPILHTVYAKPGYDFKGERNKALEKLKGKQPGEEPLSETKARLLENIKAEKGSSELINDLSRLGADAIKRGHKSFKAFSTEMKTVLGDAWAKVKDLMLKAYADAKKILKSERGVVEIGGKKEPKKDLPAFMQDFLAKAKAEFAPEFGSAKATPPPIGPKADPKKVNSWLADNTDSATKSIVHYLNMDLNILEQVMASPEYYQHPVMKKIVRFFTRTRPETYHHYFNHLNDTELSRNNDVVQQLKDLKGKGVFWGKRQIGSVSKEYKIFKKMTDTVDIEWKKDPKDSMEEHLDKVEKAWRARGATDDVIAAYRAQRGAYERGLALQRRQMEELLDKMVKKKASKISKITFGKKESTKRYGKQYLENPDLFSSFRTVTHKTAEKWDLPSTKGIMYVVGTYTKGGGQDVQSVNFDKNVFDETAATDWWNKNKEEVSIPLGDTAQIRELRKTLKQALASMGRLEGTYAPRQRDPGDYAVLASKKIASGKIRTYRNHKVSHFAANRLAKRLEREGWIVKPVEDVRKQPEDVYQNIKTISVANALDEAARTMSQRKDLNADLAISFREDLIEQMANEIKARGFRASMIHRKAEGVVEGYNDDPLERMLIWMNSLSSGLAKAHVSELATRAMLGEFKDGKRVGGIDSAAEKRVYSVATKYLTEQLRNTETSDRLIGLAKSITTFKYLGFNARSVTVNLTAMVTTVPAAMHQALNGKVSFVKIGKEIGSAGKDYAKFMAGKPFGNAKDQAFAEQVRKLGWDDPQYTREALSNLSNSHERIWTKMMDASMYVFGKAEQWNRGSTMLATYRLAIKQGHNEAEAADMAKGASDSAHATYGKATYPIWAQDTNVFAKGSQLFYMYGKFGHNYVQLCYDLGMRKHNIKAFAWAALSPVVLAGGMVLPFKDEMFWFFGGILRALGVDRDPEKWWWDSVRRYLGDKGELVARHGITGLMGGDISGSLSIGVGVPRGLLDLVGAPGGVAKDIWQAGKFVTTQQYGRAAEKILPRGFENIARAVRERETGLVTQRGQRKWTVEDRAYQPTGFETGLRAAGFRSTKQAVLAEREWEAKKEERVYNKRKSEIYEMYRAYLMRPNKPDKHKGIRKLVNKFNADIKGKNVARITFESMKRQAKRMRKPTKRQAERLQ